MEDTEIVIRIDCVDLDKAESTELEATFREDSRISKVDHLWHAFTLDHATPDTIHHLPSYLCILTHLSSVAGGYAAKTAADIMTGKIKEWLKHRGHDDLDVTILYDGDQEPIIKIRKKKIPTK